jgi:hypothetical protein
MQRKVRGECLRAQTGEAGGRLCPIHPQKICIENFEPKTALRGE